MTHGTPRQKNKTHDSWHATANIKTHDSWHATANVMTHDSWHATANVASVSQRAMFAAAADAPTMTVRVGLPPLPPTPPNIRTTHSLPQLS